MQRHSERLVTRKKKSSVKKGSTKKRLAKNPEAVVMIFSLILLVLGLFVLVDSLLFLKNATTTTGTVTSCLKEKYGCTPTVDFTAADGEAVTVTMSIFIPYKFIIGQRVPILYNPDNPQNARIADFLSLWYWPLNFLGFGSFYFLVKAGEAIVHFFLAAPDRNRRSGTLKERKNQAKMRPRSHPKP